MIDPDADDADRLAQYRERAAHFEKKAADEPDPVKKEKLSAVAESYRGLIAHIEMGLRKGYVR
jgi:hypothetical protein